MYWAPFIWQIQKRTISRTFKTYFPYYICLNRSQYVEWYILKDYIKGIIPEDLLQVPLQKKVYKGNTEMYYSWESLSNYDTNSWTQSLCKEAHPF